ncbi:MAG: alpha/beta fold hydrolase [Thermoplasmatota archaeon]
MSAERLRLRDGTDLAYETRGSDGPRIVMLHGALAARRAMLGVALRIPACRVTLVDARGHGDSTPYGGAVNPWSRFDHDVMRDDAIELLERITGPAHVVGASMGGIVAARVATARPDLVCTLALLSTPLAPHPEVRAYFARLSPETLPEPTRRLAAHWHGEPYWRELAAALFARLGETYARRDTLPHDTLVLQGDHDEMLPPEPRATLAPGDHAFFADGREGTKAASDALIRHVGRHGPATR